MSSGNLGIIKSTHFHGCPTSPYLFRSSHGQNTLLKQSHNILLKRRQVSTNNIPDLLALLEQHERRHRAHSQLLCDILHLLHVDLVELRPGVGFAEFLDLRRDRLAGAAPFCVAVEDHVVFGVEDLRAEVGEAVTVSCVGGLEVGSWGRTW